MERPITFDIAQKGPGLARAGVIRTAHGDVPTPCFVPVGTKATVKAMTPDQLRNIGLSMLIANTYHLYLSPGEKTVERAGGVGKFMGWERPTMTDSGGFQVFSLGEGIGRKVSKFLPESASDEEGLNVWSEELATSHGKLAIIDEDGVTFTSHLDGSLHRFTPERSIEIQHSLGADIIFAFDECTSPVSPREYQIEAMHRTHAWAKRSLAAHRQNIEKNAQQGIYGIVQGGRYDDLRTESARALAEMDFDGYGIGGSFHKKDILGTVEVVNSVLPEEKPRHLLGVGEPEDILIGAAAGCDTFDILLPTRNGRNGTIYTGTGKIPIGRAEYKEDFSPLDAACGCFVCTQCTRSYIHHLFRCNEMLGPILATAHNLYFFNSFVQGIRGAILDGGFEEYRAAFLKQYRS
jgi:queuine tRNA-ribosyltransferase